jgi:acyl-CoA dehydrogenase
MGRLPKALAREVSSAVSLAREFNTEIVRSKKLELDRQCEKDPDKMPLEIVRAAQERGFFSAWLPRFFGGKGLTPFSMMPFNEELSSECLGVANLIGAHYVAISLLSATLNTRVLRKICEKIILAEKNRAEPVLLSTAITEPAAGSDLEDNELIKHARVGCIAKKVAGGYRVSGSKIFTSNAALATYHIVVAYSDAKDPGSSPVVMAVHKNNPGLRLGRQERKMGQHVCPATELVFRDCFVADEWVAMAPDQYESIDSYRKHCDLLIDDVLPMSRAGVGALGSGAARSALKIATDFCARQVSGKDLLINQEWVQAELAEMQKNVKAAQLNYWEAVFAQALIGPFRDMQRPFVYGFLAKTPRFFLCFLLGDLLSSFRTVNNLRKKRIREIDSGKAAILSGLGSVAKIMGSDHAQLNCRIALNLMGETGLRQSEGVEKILRDSKLLQIYEGTNELNRVNLFKSFIGSDRPEVEVFR